MPNKAKDRPKKGGGGEALMAKMGLSDMDAMDAMIYGNLDDDEELEAELLALQGQPSPHSSPKKSGGGSRAEAGGAGGMNFDKLVADSLKDLPSDEELSDTEDPDLLDELQKLSAEPEAYEPPAKTSAPAPSNGDVVSLLNERLDMYHLAVASARSVGDSSKAKRMDRGIKTLEDLLKKARSGRAVSEDDIPPPVATATAAPSVVHIETPPRVYEPTAAQVAEPKPEPPAPKSESKQINDQPSELIEHGTETHALLSTRREQYKTAALKCKQTGDETTAKKYMKISKQFEAVLSALEEGRPIDLSLMPPPPPEEPEREKLQSSSQETPSPAASSTSSPQHQQAVPDLTEQDKEKLFGAPESASSVLEALEQRLAKYQSGVDTAKQEGNSSKARRMGRIVKQYQDAIKSHKTNKPVNYDELPCPPGFPPIPGVSSSPGSEATTPTSGGPSLPSPSQPQAPSQPSAAQAAPMVPPRQAAAQAPAAPAPAAGHMSQATRQAPRSMHRQMSATSRAESQAIFLQERQLQFRKAALAAKKNGDLALAKNYLRLAKGFDQMIVAAQSGLPVDLSQVPPPPGSASVTKLEFIPVNENNEVLGDRDEAYKRLEQDLIQQIQTCTTNADHFTKLGDVSSASRFDKMGQNSRRDLAAVKNAYKHGDPVPRFHYETRSFTLVQSCTDLGDNTLEVHILRGLNLNLPSGYNAKDLDTYVKYEFPYPADDPQKGETDICKHTDNPEYNQSFKLDINRKSRAFLRLIKSNKFLKCEVLYKRGFLKSDKTIGTANIKLQPLETHCVIHESFDLSEGRKSVGGKLEVKIRVRHPFVSKQVEETQERWLVIDQIERKLQPPQTQPAARQKSPNNMAAPTSGAGSEAPSESAPFTSMEVLKYERQLLEQQILRYKGKLTANEEEAMRHKGELLAKRIQDTREMLKKGGVATLKLYADSIEKTEGGYMQEARTLLQQGNKDKAHTLLTKKKLVQREVEAIRAKLSS